LAQGVQDVASVRNELQVQVSSPPPSTDNTAANHRKAQQMVTDARRLYNNGKYSQALDRINNAVQLDPSLANDVASLKNQIETALNPKPQVNPNHQQALALIEEGKKLTDKGAYDDAIQKYKQAKQLDPTVEPTVADLTAKALNAKYTEEQWNRTHKQ
jgi:tetratricopeptide (TPR) repeat protein